MQNLILKFGRLAAAAVPIVAMQNNPDYDLHSTMNEDRVRVTHRRRMKTVKARAYDELLRFKEVSGAPGISIAVSYGGKQIWQKGVGYADVENLVPCTPATVMRIASISKTLTMAIIAQLWEAGLLDLDADVGLYLPQFPKKTFAGKEVEITTRMLVSHLSGIRHYKTKQKLEQEKIDAKKMCSSCGRSGKPPNKAEFSQAEYYTPNMKNYRNVVDTFEMFQNDDLLSKPGEKFNYSSYGFTVASAVAEVAAGQPLPALFNRLFTELGMTSTHLDRNQTIVPSRAKYYRRALLKDGSNHLITVQPVNNSYKWAGGGLQSCVGDLLKFVHAWVYPPRNVAIPDLRQSDGSPVNQTASNRRFLSQKTIDACWTPRFEPLESAEEEVEEDEEENKENGLTTAESKLKEGPGGTKEEVDKDSASRNENKNSQFGKVKKTPMSKMPISGYGLGWRIRPPVTGRYTTDPLQRGGYVYHTGAAVGASSIIFIVPPCHEPGFDHDGLCIAVMANLESCTGLTRLCMGIARIFLEEKIDFKKKKAKRG